MGRRFPTITAILAIALCAGCAKITYTPESHFPAKVTRHDYVPARNVWVPGYYTTSGGGKGRPRVRIYHPGYIRHYPEHWYVTVDGFGHTYTYDDPSIFQQSHLGSEVQYRFKRIVADGVPTDDIVITWMRVIPDQPPSDAKLEREN